ncbi:fused MFS/spermidine synthase [Hydrogenophaga pseudoflava]|uniref:Spermidine synthase n=1 Tax=Hydrogenophaga pseudoflava TaxID=47421 RepID=A0A4P6X3U7_HYDPS|nr:fused MFS/spermidine synthase [Hydrogenophaga pseudoflava]QBM28374.1 spermidine synthase [Hydrogenophaga pseudoflava]
MNIKSYISAPALIPLIIFIEGFCSLGAEIVALRRLVPHVGSAIVVTAPTIGFFLLALALGYAAGGKVTQGHLARVTRNFLLSGVIVGVGLAGPVVNALFAQLQPVWLAYLVFIGGVLCPIAWLLGQTVPILSNLMKHDHVGQASGTALYWSTLGSFLGSVSLSVIVMQFFGVSTAVLTCTFGLLAGALLLQPRPLGRTMLPVAVGVGVIVVNLTPIAAADTAYADYQVMPLDSVGHVRARMFMSNNSLSSQIDDSTPPKVHPYISHIRRTLLDDLGFRKREVLVLGAGGFTLSQQEPLNRYTYVDIDPAIHRIAEDHFLRAPIQGEFVAQDARRYVLETARRFDAVVVDVFSDRAAIPSHLVTREFWQATQKTLQPEGVLLANLILDSRLASPYARHVLDTMESVYGRCSTEVLRKGQALSNVIAVCHAGGRPEPRVIYSDERNKVDFEKYATGIR